MVERREYLQKLILWRDEQVIKVVTGIRRCGKSTLLAQFQDYLKRSGVESGRLSRSTLKNWRMRNSWTIGSSIRP